MLLSFITIFHLTGYSSDNFVLILSCITLLLYLSLCHLGNGHMDLGHHMGVPKLLTWSTHSLGASTHLEHILTWSTLSLGAHSHLENSLTWRTVTVLTICLTSLFTIKCWLLQNKVFKLKAVYQKFCTWSWTWSWKYNSTHQIGGGNRSVTWTFAEIRQYAAADCHDFEDGHEFNFMSNVHEDIS